MTVKELREALSQHPDELKVVTYWEFENIHETVEIVVEREWKKLSGAPVRVVVLYASADDVQSDSS